MPAIKDTFNYPGRKKTMLRFIINRIPPHKRYVELFAGSGHIAINKRISEELNVINDIAPSIINKINCSSDYLKISMSALDFIRHNLQFVGREWFVYLDPPYPLSSRNSNRHLYTNKMTDDDHRELLSGIQHAGFNCMISTYPNEIYKEFLVKWNYEDLIVRTRQGPSTERIYYNYKKPVELHEYTWLGENFTERQRINRKVFRKLQSIKAMPGQERLKLLEQIVLSFGKLL